MKTLIIDNYDSFTNNIAQYVYRVTNVSPVVVTNDYPFHKINLSEFNNIILSPGPGTPEKDEDFGICKRIIKEVNMPILGICLGHQGINHCFGGEVGKAPKPVHGYKELIVNSGDNIFKGLPNSFFAVRYHSLICTKLAPSLEATAYTQDGLIMAIAHKELPIYGVQFHPESIDSEFGVELIKNFIDISAEKSYGRPLHVRDFA